MLMRFVVRDAWMDANSGSVTWCLSVCDTFVASVRLRPWALVVLGLQMERRGRGNDARRRFFIR